MPDPKRKIERRIATAQYGPPDPLSVFRSSFIVAPRLFAHQKIQLKLGVPIMLLRTIYQSMGLCNGTRLIVTQLGDWVPEAEIRTGSHIRHHTCIPQIVLNALASR